MISLAEARAIIQTNIRSLAPQTVELSGAQGRVLREDVRAREDLPAFDRSAMDGYAVGLEDDSKQFRVVGEIQPGVEPGFKILRGETARIFTGAKIPDGASQVIMQEHVCVEGNFITPTRRNRATNIRKRGKDARRGDVLLKIGMRLGAGELSLLASLGVAQPKVSPPCRVAHFTTGNELVDPSQEPNPGQIRDSNSTLVAALVRQFGGEFARQKMVPDNFELLREEVQRDEKLFDLLLISGGASVGDYDFGKQLLGAIGFQIHFDKINLRPGKPLVFATRGSQAAFILPGNPVSHFVTFHVAVRMALELFAGTAASWPLAQVALDSGIEHRPDARETYWPARVIAQQGRLVAQPLRWQSSGDVAAMAGVNALLQFAATLPALTPGNPVNALLLDLT
jgi:molybdopterin molybdotransferase